MLQAYNLWPGRDCMSRTRSKSTIAIAIVGSVIFILVLTVGTIYTSLGRQTNISDYKTNSALGPFRDFGKPFIDR